MHVKSQLLGLRSTAQVHACLTCMYMWVHDVHHFSLSSVHGHDSVMRLWDCIMYTALDMPAGLSLAPGCKGGTIVGAREGGVHHVCCNMSTNPPPRCVSVKRGCSSCRQGGFVAAGRGLRRNVFTEPQCGGADSKGNHGSCHCGVANGLQRNVR